MYKINLLPVELQQDLSIDVKGLLKRVGMVSVVLLLLFGYSAYLYAGYLAQKEINDTERYLEQLAPRITKIESIKAQRIKNEASTEKFTELLHADWTSFPIPMLEAISHSMPVELWLASIDISYVAPVQTAANTASGAAQGQTAHPQLQAQAPSGNHQGVSPAKPNTLVLAGYASSVSSVGLFVHNLTSLPYFSSVVLNEIHTDEQKGHTSFKLTAQLKEVGQ